MATLYAGTVGWGIWKSEDLGDSWKPAFPGVYLENRVWSMSAHPAEPNVVWAGTDVGLMRNAGKETALVGSPADGPTPGIPGHIRSRCIWSIAQAPSDPSTLLIGTNPGALYRSDDGGASWRELPVELVESCGGIEKPRVTRIRFDPFNADEIWVSIEIDAVHHTTDGGETWEKLDNGFKFPDIHDLAVVDDNGARKLLAATAVGLYVSTDDGQTWNWSQLDTPWQYCRGIKPRADLDGTVFLCNGDGPPGSTGRLWRSRDWGDTWEDCNLGKTNSTPWTVATMDSDPDLLFTCTILAILWTLFKRPFDQIPSAVGRAVIFLSNWRPSRR